MSMTDHSDFLSRNADLASVDDRYCSLSSRDGYVVTLNASGRQVEYHGEAVSLLEVLEQNQVVVEYQCRSGYCGSCRCRMTKGKVTYLQKPLALINDGEILPCSCRPDSDIELDI